MYYRSGHLLSHSRDTTWWHMKETYGPWRVFFWKCSLAIVFGKTSQAIGWVTSLMKSSQFMKSWNGLELAMSHLISSPALTTQPYVMLFKVASQKIHRSGHPPRSSPRFSKEPCRRSTPILPRTIFLDFKLSDENSAVHINHLPQDRKINRRHFYHLFSLITSFGSVWPICCCCCWWWWWWGRHSIICECVEVCVFECW